MRGDSTLAGTVVGAAPPGMTVAPMELTVTGKWLQWSTVNPPRVTVTDAAAVQDPGYSGPSTTGRMTLDKDGPLNVVVAFIKTPAGSLVSTALPDCFQTGQRRIFETKSDDDVRGPYELESVVAYTASVGGAGLGYTPDS